MDHSVKLAVMQPYLFPYIGYYQLMHAADRFVIADDVTFIKQGWINRNRLLVNGSAAYFTVPVRRHPADALIKDVEIDDRPGTRWRVTLLKTIANFYRRAPSFEQVYPLVERVIGGPFTRIADMARASLREVCDYLGAPVSIVESSAAYGNAHLKGQARVIDTCRAERATDYINAPGGRTLYSAEAFLAHGIRLHFLCPAAIEYRQFNLPFVSSLSVIDVLMFNPCAQARELLERYELA
jgi:WbqC-like protein family